MRSECLFNGNMFFRSTVGKYTRECIKGMRVRVYRNLNKPDYYSILAMEGIHKRLVCGYAKSIVLENVTFVVSEKSRHRVLKTKTRNVHAYCDGYIIGAFEMAVPCNGFDSIVTYNPFVLGSFYHRSTRAPVNSSCAIALLQGANAYVNY